ncbi:U32 family peptidase [Oceanispirochaeta sp.]|jgi:putative protease|uniref:U32 family peptidase n=1 Tax=Oceanispirochaeta sp. TaxID=2035350 RepID=UPI00260A39B4|nr:U32 family peptidase [Oceanispirochaeta sp.]MDA3956754.1 U32 family peptidase [Oceanispirochaeta sp.]
MSREFNGRPLELLAPAGTFGIYKSMIRSSCDAIYCGGQVLNMRMIRKGYNFSHDELKEAVFLAREVGKKIYITINSLIDEKEISQAEDYLGFLEEIRPHALIVQDAAILDIVRESGMTLPLHSSVMMNVHNAEMIRFLARQGVERVVLSREMTLQEVRLLAEQTDVELEYFTHGDMCVTHGSQCLYSSYLFGMSSNRGRCLKPCRWPFTNLDGEKPFPLAVKDLSLYSHLGDLVLAGISSLKIEGRMREKEFILDLVNRYGGALDRFLDDPLGGAQADAGEIEEFKKRDYSTGYAFGNPGIENINTRGEGSGQFYSTGKMFSTPTQEKEISLSIPPEEVPFQPEAGLSLKMTVRVNTVAQARLALDCGADRIYLSAEPFAPDRPASFQEIQALYGECSQQGRELFLALPRMMKAGQIELFRAYFNKKPALTGVLAGHAGIFEMIDVREYSIVCDSAMNLYNARAVGFYTARGASGWTASLELPFDSLAALPGDVKSRGGSLRGEVVLHGLPGVMYMDHDVSRIQEDQISLETQVSRLTLRRDWWDRSHLLPHKELCLLPRLPALVNGGYRFFRLELQAYTLSDSESIMKTYRQALDEPARAVEFFHTLKSCSGGYTYGAHQF